MVSGQLHAPVALPLGKDFPGTRFMKHRVLSRPSLNTVEQSLMPLPGIEPRLLGRATRSLLTITNEISRILFLCIYGSVSCLRYVMSRYVSKHNYRCLVGSEKLFLVRVSSVFCKQYVGSYFKHYPRSCNVLCL
jgi:hypothetical protein